MLNKQNNVNKRGSERVREARKRSQKRGYIADINMRAVAVLVAAFIILALLAVSGMQKVTKFLDSSKVPNTEMTTEIADEKLKKQKINKILKRRKKLKLLNIEQKDKKIIHK